MRVVATSGYFNPLHRGHVELIQEARKLGDALVVIVNNDEQVKVKGSVPFMNETERCAIVREIKGVDAVFLSVDTDSTVCKSLEFVQPSVFAKGGDKHSGNIPEAQICRELGIQIVDGLGAKIQSSSTLLKEAGICKE